MRYNRQKFLRMEQKSVALLAVLNHLSDVLTDRRREYLSLLHGIQNGLLQSYGTLESARLVDGAKVTERTDMIALAENDPKEFTSRVMASTHFRPRIGSQAEALVKAFERLGEASSAYEAHQAVMGRFSPAFAGCKALVAKLEGERLAVSSPGGRKSSVDEVLAQISGEGGRAESGSEVGFGGADDGGPEGGSFRNPRRWADFS